MIEKNQLIVIGVFAALFSGAALYHKCSTTVTNPPAPPGKVEVKNKTIKKTTKVDGKTGDTTIVVDTTEDVTVTTTPIPRPDYRVGIGRWIDPIDLKRDKIYEVTVSRRIAGDVWGDIGVSSDKKIKVGVSIEF